MSSQTSDPDGREPTTASDDYDRYSHVTTESGEIIYDTEADDAWLQADSSVRLHQWR